MYQSNGKRNDITNESRCRKIKKGGLLSWGETITIVSTGLQPFELIPDPSVPLKIIHEESSFLIVEKSSGIPTHPLKSGEKGTLANALVVRYPELCAIGDPREAGLVHRLDTPTSGLLIVARTLEAHDFFRKQFQSNQVLKKYLALVWGRIDEKGEIETSFDSKDRKKVRVMPKINEKFPTRKTLFTPLGWRKDQTLLEVEILSGHRHQIRAHLAHLGHPIVGDPVYGKRGQIPILFLHAMEISLIHPTEKQKVEFRGLPIENHWKEILTEIKIPT